MTKIAKIKDQISTALLLRKSAKRNELLGRCEIAMCRKLGIRYSTRYGDYGSAGYRNYRAVYGQEIDSRKEALTAISKHLATLRRQLKREEAKPQRTGLCAEEQVTKLIEKNEQEAVALALYNISKIAKQARDRATELRERIYSDDESDEYDDGYSDSYDDYDDYDDEPRYRKHGTSSQHQAMHAASARKEELYEAKDKYLTLAIQRYNLTSPGYHTFGDGEKRDLYEFAGFRFHLNRNESTTDLGEITDEITAEKKGKKLSAKTAMAILERVFTPSPIILPTHASAI